MINWPVTRQHFPSRTRAGARAREAAGNQRPWPADKVERWSIDRLIPYAKNARTHTDAQVAAIAASIKEWGWTTPALVGEDVNLAGEVGMIAAGKLADLVIWDSDPLADITVLQRPAEIFLIIKDGRIVDREARGFRQLIGEPPRARTVLTG